MNARHAEKKEKVEFGEYTTYIINSIITQSYNRDYTVLSGVLHGKHPVIMRLKVPFLVSNNQHKNGFVRLKGGSSEYQAGAHTLDFDWLTCKKYMQGDQGSQVIGRETRVSLGEMEWRGFQ